MREAKLDTHLSNLVAEPIDLVAGVRGDGAQECDEKCNRERGTARVECELRIAQQDQRRVLPPPVTGGWQWRHARGRAVVMLMEAEVRCGS